eukprot:gene18627-25142_t
MGGWTRLLHEDKADDLMDELPTMVADTLPSEIVDHSWAANRGDTQFIKYVEVARGGRDQRFIKHAARDSYRNRGSVWGEDEAPKYVVLNRPYAFDQWAKKANIPERFVLMAEPDHVFLKPIPNLMVGDTPASFPFFYIEPAKDAYAPITQKFTGKLSREQLHQIAPIGNSPTFLTMDQMKTSMPIWMNISIAIFKDKEASKAWGWVQEMYGFCIAIFMAGITKVDLHPHLMAQPPWDKNMHHPNGKPFLILHYTYGMDYKLTGEFTPGKYGEWRYDKRSYGNRPMPRNVSDPPTGMKNDLVRTLIESFNEATDAIPCWDDYQKTHTASIELYRHRPPSTSINSDLHRPLSTQTFIHLYRLRPPSTFIDTDLHRPLSTQTSIDLYRHRPPSASINSDLHRPLSAQTSIGLYQLRPPSTFIDTDLHRPLSTQTSIDLYRHRPPSASINSDLHRPLSTQTSIEHFLAEELAAKQGSV